MRCASMSFSRRWSVEACENAVVEVMKLEKSVDVVEENDAQLAL